MSRDLFPLITGLLFNVDTQTRLIHFKPMTCKRMTPKEIKYYFILYTPFGLEDL